MKEFVELRTRTPREALASFADAAFDLIFLDAERRCTRATGRT